MKKRLVFCLLIGLSFSPMALAEGENGSSKAKGKSMACQGISLAYSKAQGMSAKDIKAQLLNKKAAK